MARRKATLTIDRAQLLRAQELTGPATMSDAVDLALTRLVRAEELRRDVAAYRSNPPGDGELGDLAVTFDLADDDVDYDALYG